jgi:predicted glycosyl hydrolase (DUF1957 family)
MIWANFFHIYQPPHWPKTIIAKVARQSYRPLLKILGRHPGLKITLNISGSLTEQLAKNGSLDIIKNIKALAHKRQIELVGTALYHPILPLLPEREIIRQIEQNTLLNKKFFGHHYQPRGFFPPEMCYSKKVGKIVEKMKFQWLILDEISGNGKLGEIKYDRAYLTSKTGLQIVFRNRTISDYLSFHSDSHRPNDFWPVVRRDGRSNKILITAMDGENLGHHRPGLNRLWEKLVTHTIVQTMTISGLLAHYQKEKIIQPRAASWSSREIELHKNNPYGLWHDPANPIHYWQWQLIDKVIKHLNASQKGKQYHRARRLLDQQLASDQFWWASAKPWWSLDIIEKKTNELVRTACLVDGDRSLKKIGEKIIGLARTWQREQKFQTIARDYLAAEERDNVRFIGGKKISI